MLISCIDNDFVLEVIWQEQHSRFRTFSQQCKFNLRCFTRLANATANDFSYSSQNVTKSSEEYQEQMAKVQKEYEDEVAQLQKDYSTMSEEKRKEYENVSKTTSMHI